MFKFFSGYKTYFASAIGVIVIALAIAGVVSFETATAICALIGFTIPAFLRDAIKTEAQRAAQQIASPSPPAAP